MTIKEGNIYSLSGATDYPYCLALVIKKQEDSRNHILIVYRPQDETTNNFKPDERCLYSILEKQGRLHDLPLFIQHLGYTGNYIETCDVLGIERYTLQQAPYYSGELVSPPPSLFENKHFLPYASQIGLGDLRIEKLPTTFL